MRRDSPLPCSLEGIQISGKMKLFQLSPVKRLRGPRDAVPVIEQFHSSDQLVYLAGTPGVKRARLRITALIQRRVMYEELEHGRMLACRTRPRQTQSGGRTRFLQEERKPRSQQAGHASQQERGTIMTNLE